MTMALDMRTIDAAIDRALGALNRFDEAVTRQSVDKSLAPIEEKLQTRVAYLFGRQGVRVVRALGKRRAEFREALGDDFDDLFDDATSKTSIEMQEAIEAAAKAALIEAGKTITREMDWTRVFSLTNPRAAAYIRDVGANAVTRIDDTTRREIRAIVLAGIENGTSYAEVARQIKRRYQQYAAGVPQKHIRSRAELIAVTEAGNAYQTGNFIQIGEIAAAGVKMQKRWLTSGDDRVSDGCRDNQAQDWIPYDQAHNSGHDHPLRFPGCRCVELYRRKPSK